MLDKAKAPAEVLQDQGRGELAEESVTNKLTSQKPKRKLGNFGREGRYLYRSGPNGSTVFDVWKWKREPLERRPG